MRNLVRISTGFILFSVLALPIYAQNMTLADALSGKTVPLTLKLNELNGDWRHLTASSQGSSSSTFMMLAMMGMHSNGDNLLQLMKEDTFYTRGQTVSCGKETFLLAYRVEGTKSGLQALMETASHMDEEEDATTEKSTRITPETPLTLCLLNLRECGSLLNILPFDLQKATTNGAAMNATQIKALASQSASNLRQVAAGILMYTQDNNGSFPPMKDAAAFTVAMAPYLGENSKLFKNPFTMEPYQLNASLSQISEAKITTPTEIACVFEATPAPDGLRTVGFCDGHATRVTEEKWTMIKKASGIP